MSIAFGFIGEFILRRSDEVGHENWGKAISCDPPQHFPDIKYYWSRDYFPNFVEEDRRVMVRIKLRYPTPFQHFHLNIFKYQNLSCNILTLYKWFAHFYAFQVQ